MQELIEATPWLSCKCARCTPSWSDNSHVAWTCMKLQSFWPQVKDDDEVRFHVYADMPTDEMCYEVVGLWCDSSSRDDDDSILSFDFTLHSKHAAITYSDYDTTFAMGEWLKEAMQFFPEQGGFPDESLPVFVTLEVRQKCKTCGMPEEHCTGGGFPEHDPDFGTWVPPAHDFEPR